MFYCRDVQEKKLEGGSQMLCRNRVYVAKQRKASRKLTSDRFRRTLNTGRRKERSILNLQGTLDRVVKKIDLGPNQPVLESKFCGLAVTVCWAS